MMHKMTAWLSTRLIDFINYQYPATSKPQCNFERLRHEIRPGDVILVEGRSRGSEVIKLVTQSPWTHAALYIGRIYDIEDPILRDHLSRIYQGEMNEQLLIEAVLGQGTVVTPLTCYHQDHLRICRPHGLSHTDAQQVIGYGIGRLGLRYSVRQIFDLFRFMFPYAILPRRWRSSLFAHHAGESTRTVCSCLLAEAFNAVQFPILPFIEHDQSGRIYFHKTNPRLFTPKDFDYSPYFDIIKYPYLGLEDRGIYRQLPWSDQPQYPTPTISPPAFAPVVNYRPKTSAVAPLLSKLELWRWMPLRFLKRTTYKKEA